MYNLEIIHTNNYLCNQTQRKGNTNQVFYLRLVSNYQDGTLELFIEVQRGLIILLNSRVIECFEIPKVKVTVLLS